MPKLQQLPHGQYILTIPEYVVECLKAEKGSILEFAMEFQSPMGKVTARMYKKDPEKSTV